jgi:hypothetical protein
MHAHLNNARHIIKRLPSQLHVIAVVFNPLRFQSGYSLFRRRSITWELLGARST